MIEDQTTLLPPGFIRQLQRLHVISRHAASGARAGRRRSRHAGSSIEFADYRSYAPGDDLRQLDWNAYARSGKLFIKKFLDEQEMHITLYLDCSASMTFGEPSKFTAAKQVAAAIGYLSLQHYDFVSVFAFDEQAHTSLRSLQGKGKSALLFRFLTQLQASGKGDLRQAFTSGGAVHGKAGVSVVLSDFFYTQEMLEGLAFLQASNQEVVLMHMTCAEDRDPVYEGALRLIDSESGAVREVAVTPQLLQDYQDAQHAHQQQLKDFAAQRGMRYIHLEAEESVEDRLIQRLRQAGIIG